MTNLQSSYLFSKYHIYSLMLQLNIQYYVQIYTSNTGYQYKDTVITLYLKQYGSTLHSRISFKINRYYHFHIFTKIMMSLIFILPIYLTNFCQILISENLFSSRSINVLFALEIPLLCLVHLNL